MDRAGLSALSMRPFLLKAWRSTTQVAKALGCSSQTVLNLYECGLIKGYRLTAHGWLRFEWESVTRYMNFVARRRHGKSTWTC